MQSNTINCRKRRRRPTMTPRFGQSSLAFEIGLIRLSLEIPKEFEERKTIKGGK